jgi:hypothetical protein
MRKVSLSLVIHSVTSSSAQRVLTHWSARDYSKINGDKHIILYFDSVCKVWLCDCRLYDTYQARRNHRWSSDTFVC